MTHKSSNLSHNIEESTIIKRIGNTPLLNLTGIFGKSDDVSIFAKAEWYNPGGSIKDRAALSMIRAGEEEGKLNTNKIVLDATSGNTGIGLAMICSALNYRLSLVIPENVSKERKTILNAYGANTTYTNPLEGIDEAIKKAREMFSENPEKYFYVDQYSNEANWKAHYKTTGPEIIEQTEGKITHFVAGVGTGGTIGGIGRKLKEYNKSIKIIEVQPDSPFHGLEGLKHMETALIPKIYNEKLRDDLLNISTEEAQRMTVKLAREKGILVGPSSGAALVASLKVASEIKQGMIVTVFPDSGFRYASESFWREV